MSVELSEPIRMLLDNPAGEVGSDQFLQTVHCKQQKNHLEVSLFYHIFSHFCKIQKHNCFLVQWNSQKGNFSSEGKEAAKLAMGSEHLLIRQMVKSTT